MRQTGEREDQDRAAQAWLDDEEFPCRCCGKPVRFGDAVKWTDGSVVHEECNRDLLESGAYI